MNHQQHTPEAENPPGHYISPDQLRVGLYIHLDLGWMQHPFTFGSFKIKDEAQLSKVRELGLKKIRYDPKRSDVKPTAARTQPKTPIQAPQHPAPQPERMITPDPKQRAARLKQLNEAIIQSEQSFNKDAVTVREVVRHLEDHPERAREVATAMVKNMVNSAITEHDVVLHAIGNRTRSQENYVHPLNVTVLALTLAKSLDMGEDEAALLGLAAMFHDVGKAASLKGKSFMDIHCEIGASIAGRSGLPERVSRIILQHHECVDGSGFPKHLRENDIDPLARLLALVNHFDNLCNPPNLADAMTPYEAMSTMYAMQQHKFDTSMLRMMVRSFGVYPPGSVVQLSNGAYGIALTTNPDKPMLPLVMIHAPGVARETPVVVELGQETNLTIKKCMRPEHLPPEVFQYLSPCKRMSYYFLKESDSAPENTESAGSGNTDVIASAPQQRRA